MNTTRARAGYDALFRSHNLFSAALAAALVLAVCAGTARGACSLTVSGTLTISGILDVDDCVDVTSTGKIFITGTGTLILNGNHGNNTSTIAGGGFIQLQGSNSRLRIATNSHSLAGGGYVEGQNDSAKIEIGSSLTLTSTTTIAGPLTMEATSATFTNNGYVVADYVSGANETLMLSAGTVNGSGEWQVNANGAVLQFGPNLTSAKLTGPFKVYEGTLDIDKSVCTTGALDFQKQAGGTNPRIDVAAGCCFSAKQASCP